jgi:hypothetical protein
MNPDPDVFAWSKVSPDYGLWKYPTTNSGWLTFYNPTASIIVINGNAPVPIPD